MAFSYGDPTRSVNLLGPKPPCWGTSKYDNEDRECRACGFQNTCRDQVIKLKPVTPAPVPVASFFNQYQTPTPYAAPQPAPQPAQQFVRVTPTPVQPAQVQMKPVVPATGQVQPAQFNDRYGQFQDPMFNSIKATPSVLRPQFPNESFPTRVAKNMALAGLESAIGELLLGVRQFIWAPKPDDDQNK